MNWAVLQAAQAGATAAAPSASPAVPAAERRAQRQAEAMHDCRALVVDPNPTSRSILAAQLRDFGLLTVVQCSRLQDARRQLEVREFDIVLCEQDFPAEKSCGQDLLDDLRRAQLLPLATVFVMITGEAAYNKVAEAAESALDSYLLKPHTAKELGVRLQQSRRRKVALKPIFDAVEQGDFDQGARLCLQRFHDRGAYWLYAARIGAELLLRLGQPQAAQKLCEAVIEAQALPWAKLGVARAQIDNQQTGHARRTLESLIVESPTYADAYDVMGRMQLEQGDLGQALSTYRQASELTPGSIARLQKQGMLAFYLGEHEEAAKSLERAASLGISSKMFDFQSLVLLAFARFHERDGKGLQRCLDNLQHALEKAPDSVRLQRFVRVVKVVSLMLAKQVGAVVPEMRALAADLRTPSLDVEAACNLLSLNALLTAAELRLDDAERWIEALALRFCTTKGLSELMARTASAHPPFEQQVRDAHLRVTALAEQAMSHALAGDPATSVRQLHACAEKTLNLKLMDMARGALGRYHDRIPDAQALGEQIEELRGRYAASALAPAMGQTGGRAAGGVTLRASASSPASDSLKRDAAAAPSPAAAPARG